jgi:CHAD domain-containing protein
MNMRDYALGQTRILLERVALQVNRAAVDGDSEAIHDLRVAIRRLRCCLRTFAQFYPAKSWKPVRRRLRELTEACGGVRDRDIAIELLEKAGVEADAPLVRQLGEERGAAEAELRRELGRWREDGFRQRWSARLEL